MTILTKVIETDIIPGSPSSPGTPGSPYIPAYCSTTIEYSAPVYTFIPTEDNPYTPEDESGGYWTWITYPEGIEVTTCYDAVEAVAGIPADPGTPDQIIEFYNDGWNSHSTSISSLDNGESFYCTFSQGIVSSYIVIGQSGMEERTVGSFSHGILVDINGVYVYENGVLVHTLFDEFIGTRELKISRRLDNSIEYSIGDRAYTSLSDFSVFDGMPAYVYAFLYSGGDALLSAYMEDDLGALQYGSSTLEATSSIEAHDIRAGAILEATSTLSAHDIRAGAVLNATSSLIIRTSPQVILTATSAIYAKAATDLTSNTYLGSLNGSSGESSFIEQKTVNLGALTGEFTEGNIIPATPIRAQGNLPVITGISLLYGARLNTFVGDINIPAPKINASFGMFGDLDIPKPTVSGAFISMTTLNGDLNNLTPLVSGTISVTSLFKGDIKLSKPTISGSIVNGYLLTGDLNVPKIKISGTFNTDDDFIGDLNVPIPKISGIITSTITDSVWEYSGSTSCQQ